MTLEEEKLIINEIKPKMLLCNHRKQFDDWFIFGATKCCEITFGSSCLRFRSYYFADYDNTLQVHEYLYADPNMLDKSRNLLMTLFVL
jgi:hypothetical protein